MYGFSIRATASKDVVIARILHPFFSRETMDNLLVILNTEYTYYFLGINISRLSTLMPSINSRDNLERLAAKKFCRDCGLSYKGYRRLISKLRKYYKIQEEQKTKCLKE